MRVSDQPACVLHSAPYRETSVRLEFLTRDHGRIGAIARGAKRPGSALRGLLQPFQPLLVGWSGRGDLVTLHGAEPAGPAWLLSGKALYCGLYMNELLIRLLHRDDPHESVYDSYVMTLATLAPDDAEATLRIFEKRLLDDLGYGLVLDHEAGGRAAIEPGRQYCYDIEQGPLPGPAPCRRGIAVRGASLLALAREQLGSDDLKDIKRLMRAALATHLGDRPLMSRALFRATGPAVVAHEGEPGSD
jgi:DNA repair protein RecO (recombination protein O)